MPSQSSETPLHDMYLRRDRSDFTTDSPLRRWQYIMVGILGGPLLCGTHSRRNKQDLKSLVSLEKRGLLVRYTYLSPGAAKENTGDIPESLSCGLSVWTIVDRGDEPCCKTYTSLITETFDAADVRNVIIKTRNYQESTYIDFV